MSTVKLSVMCKEASTVMCKVIRKVIFTLMSTEMTRFNV